MRVTLALAVAVCTGAQAYGQAPARRVVSDVALDSNGVLQGQVVDAQGNPIAAAPVWLLGGGPQAIEARTDNAGRFAYRGLKNGVYRVGTSEDVRMCRVWAAPAAPPSSTRGVMLVGDQAAVRGQHGPPPLLNGFVKRSKAFFAHPVGMVAIGAAIATPIAIVASDDDDPPPATP